ncbi:MAG: 3-keto-5-aminohexanoate cleavage protein [Arenicellales bacterium]
MPREVIITCAVTGSVHTPSMSPGLPVTPEQIAEQAIAAARAGAAILHLHARDPETGHPTPDPDVFMQFLPRIKAECDAVVNITTGGGMGMSLEQRMAASVRAEPEMCSLNMGSINFGLFPMLNRPRDWLHDWEPEFLEASRDFVFKNTFKDIETALERLGAERGARFEFECYDVGHLYNLAHFLERGLVEPPLFIQFVLGILGGIGADTENLSFMKHTADKLFGDAYRFSTLGAGRNQLPLTMASLSLGGNVRVGLEDNLFLNAGELAPDNASQVTRACQFVEGLSLTVASPGRARELLKLKGADRVAF